MRESLEAGNREITVVGTSHVSSESRREVSETIQEVDPDLVAVELDQDRLDALRGESSWKNLDVAEAIREGRGYLLGLNVVLSIMQRQFSGEYKPGMEMLAAVEAAEEQGRELALVDQDINQTFRRAREELTLREKLRLLWSLTGKAEEIDVEEIADRNIVEQLVKELADDYPSLKRTFLDERNTYMAEKLMEKEFDTAVLVVGAAHVEGVVEALQNGEKHEPVRATGFPVYRALKYGIPAFIVASLGYSFWKLGFQTGVEASAAWILINSFLSLGGALVARAHPFTMATSFLAAPVTSLDPAIGAGMVAAYVEAKVNPPTVGELEEVSELESYGQLWHNQVGKILLVLFFVSIGSAAATFISAGYIASIISGL